LGCGVQGLAQTEFSFFGVTAQCALLPQPSPLRVYSEGLLALSFVDCMLMFPFGSVLVVKMLLQSGSLTDLSKLNLLPCLDHLVSI